eukprot:CAMPEP_0182487032 /NCGR_PEP_ID=MMETSP1319-20130603/47695_1 /TAXON_ID=172717 /ORGANISM="Bolidomonas pacifica, Strain RCC208" /LENGTH=131 /DNA_ID=CAMNT_0024689141 /DNA_START=352 /DNA_END=746 /DNA_ORIENTATION=-
MLPGTSLMSVAAVPLKTLRTPPDLKSFAPQSSMPEYFLVAPGELALNLEEALDPFAGRHDERGGEGRQASSYHHLGDREGVVRRETVPPPHRPLTHVVSPEDNGVYGRYGSEGGGHASVEPGDAGGSERLH